MLGREEPLRKATKRAPEPGLRMPSDWRGALASTDVFAALAETEHREAEARASETAVYPAASAVYRALELTPFNDVKAVILGQDPYHGPGQAHGLAFSVPVGERIPPSLRNIYKELAADLGLPVPTHGHLEPWAKAGVLLLNTSLTVFDGAAGSHAAYGWDKLTDAVIAALNAQRDGLAFVLWGAPAQKKAALIDTKRHLVVVSPHPSPLSAHRGFFGSRPFSRVNEYLINLGKPPIDWRIP